jgi:prepilin-type N-terminal cleavage/methylation domain-containing protein
MRLSCRRNDQLPVRSSNGLSRAGFTLIETLISFAILGIVFATVYRLAAPLTDFFRYGLARQKANSEARACMNTIGTAMRAGVATSVRLSTVSGVAWSRIDFNLPLPTPLASGTTAYAIYLANNRTVQMLEFVPSGLSGYVRSSQLASNVSGLIFAPLDTQDPSVMEVSLRIDAPLSSTQPNRVVTIVLNQEIHMLVNY